MAEQLRGLIRTVPGRAGHLWTPLDQAQSLAANGGPSNGAFAQGDMNVFGRVHVSTVGREADAAAPRIMRGKARWATVAPRR